MRYLYEGEMRYLEGDDMMLESRGLERLHKQKEKEVNCAATSMRLTIHCIESGQ